jgi:hypothetical protein
MLIFVLEAEIQVNCNGKFFLFSEKKKALTETKVKLYQVVTGFLVTNMYELYNGLSDPAFMYEVSVCWMQKIKWHLTTSSSIIS